MSFNPKKKPYFRVNASGFIPQRKIEEFLIAHQNWMDKQLLQLNENCELTVFGEKTEVVIIPYKSNKAIHKDNVLYLYQKDVDDKDVSVKLLTNYWKKSLREYIEENRFYYERVTGKKNVEFSYRLMTSRYGSCRPDKDKISLSTYLALFSPDIIDSVVFHEYAHFKQANHSSRFYKVLLEYYPDYYARNKELKKISLRNPEDYLK